jgi:hypothetical protein
VSPRLPVSFSRRRFLQTSGVAVAGTALSGAGYGVGRVTAKARTVSNSATDQLLRFVSRADLALPAVTMTTPPTAVAPGLIFLTPAAGAGLRGPLIVDNTGAPVWFRQVKPPADVAINLRVQRLHGKPVLTWWEGTIDSTVGTGAGEFVIADSAYREITRLTAPGHVPTDQHDFVLTEQGTALFFVYRAIAADLSAVGGSSGGALYDAVLYEIDVSTGAKVLEWQARDHVALADSHAPVPTGNKAGLPYDYFHANSIGVDTDGHLLVSSRHTWTVYKIHRTSGAVLWRFGGKRSDFAMGAGAAFSWQHDANRRSDGTLGLFDNGAGITTNAKQSRGLILALDQAGRKATLVREMFHPQGLLAPTQGDVQELPGGGSFIGWGQQPYFSEYAADGSMRFAGKLPADNVSYRAYRFDWVGQPQDKPAVAAKATASGPVTVYTSWNGATGVTSWQVRGGTQPEGLTVVGESGRTGFESAITVSGAVNFVAVDALDAARRVLGSSVVIPVQRAT